MIGKKIINMIVCHKNSNLVIPTRILRKKNQVCQKIKKRSKIYWRIKAKETLQLIRKLNKVLRFCKTNLTLLRVVNAISACLERQKLGRKIKKSKFWWNLQFLLLPKRHKKTSKLHCNRWIRSRKMLKDWETYERSNKEKTRLIRPFRFSKNYQLKIQLKSPKLASFKILTPNFCLMTPKSIKWRELILEWAQIGSTQPRLISIQIPSWTLQIR